jgi:hypothetical protein
MNKLMELIMHLFSKLSAKKRYHLFEELSNKYSLDISYANSHTYSKIDNKLRHDRMRKYDKLISLNQ